MGGTPKEANRCVGGAIPDMFDAGIRDMLLTDKHKLYKTSWTGLTMAVPTGAAASANFDTKLAYSDAGGLTTDYYSRGSTALIGGQNVVPSADHTSWPVEFQSQIADAATDNDVDANVSRQQVMSVFAPTQAWKYNPATMRLKYRFIRRRTYYNIGNYVQTLHEFLLTPKRAYTGTHGMEAPVTTPSTPADLFVATQDVTILDIQPYGEFTRSGNTLTPYAVANTNRQSGLLFFFDFDNANITPEAMTVRIANAGEYRSRFAYLRDIPFSMGEANRHLYWPQQHAAQWNMGYPHAADGTFYGITYDDPDRVGVRQDNPYASNSTIPSSSFALTQTGGPDGAIDYTIGDHFSPLKNPYLRRIFRMRKHGLMLAPSSSASSTWKSRGSVGLLRSGTFHHVHFYQEPSTAVQALRTQLFNVTPYRSPYPDFFKGPQVGYASRKRCGFATSDLWCFIRGQMGYVEGTPDPVAETKLNYASGGLVYRQRDILKFRVCSYARGPVVGGARTYYDAMAADTDMGDYKSSYPTAAPSSEAMISKAY